MDTHQTDTINSKMIPLPQTSPSKEYLKEELKRCVTLWLTAEVTGLIPVLHQKAQCHLLQYSHCLGWLAGAGKALINLEVIIEVIENTTSY